MFLKKREPEMPSIWPFDDWFDELFFSKVPFFRGRFVPAMDVYEEKDGLTIRAELPGMTEKDLQIEIDGDSLFIHGEKHVMREETEGHRVHRLESRSGEFARRVQLPSSVDPDRAKAEFKNGVLTIRFPYRQEAKKRQIKIETK